MQNFSHKQFSVYQNNTSDPRKAETKAQRGSLIQLTHLGCQNSELASHRGLALCDRVVQGFRLTLC